MALAVINDNGLCQMTEPVIQSRPLSTEDPATWLPHERAEKEKSRVLRPSDVMARAPVPGLIHYHYHIDGCLILQSSYLATIYLYRGFSAIQTVCFKVEHRDDHGAGEIYSHGKPLQESN